MIEARPATSLGRTSFSGVESIHHFCFGPYQAASRVDWGCLRMLNRMRVDAKGCRPPNFLGGMNVLLIVERGEISVQYGERQARLVKGATALLALGVGDNYGFSNIKSEPAELVEIWIKRSPSAEPTRLARATLPGSTAVIASSRPEDHALFQHLAGGKVTLLLGAERDGPLEVDLRDRAYLAVLEGTVCIGSIVLGTNDALAVEEGGVLQVTVEPDARALLVDCQ